MIAKVDEDNAEVETALAPKTKELTKEQESEGVKRYDLKVAYFVKQEDHVRRSLLELHWEKGEFVDELLRDPAKYAKRTAETFAKSIGAAAETVRSFHRFFNCYTKEEVDEVIRLKLPWRDVVYGLGIENKAERRTLMLQLASGEIDRDKFETKTKQLNSSVKKDKEAAGAKVDKRGGVTPDTLAKSTLAIGEDFAKKVDEVIEAYRELKKLPDSEKKTKLLAAFKETRKTAQLVRDKADRLFKSLDE